MESTVLISASARDALAAAPVSDHQDLLEDIQALSREIPDENQEVPATEYRVFMSRSGYGIIYRTLTRSEQERLVVPKRLQKASPLIVLGVVPLPSIEGAFANDT